MACEDETVTADQPVPPSGTVTFLFTDIEGSTELRERDRRSMGSAVARHDDLTREVTGGLGGYVFTTAGDSFAVAFGAPMNLDRVVSYALQQLIASDEDQPIED